MKFIKVILFLFFRTVHLQSRIFSLRRKIIIRKLVWIIRKRLLKLKWFFFVRNSESSAKKHDNENYPYNSTPPSKKSTKRKTPKSHNATESQYKSFNATPDSPLKNLHVNNQNETITISSDDDDDVSKSVPDVS